MSNSASIVASDLLPPSEVSEGGNSNAKARPLLRPWMRRLHHVVAWGVALPAILVFSTGILLLLRQSVSWIQPPSVMGSRPGIPVISVEQAFQAAKGVEAAGIQGWQDVTSMDIKPAKGTFAIRSRNGVEVQVDGVDGRVLSAAPRRTSLLIELHQGSFFHAKAMTWFFLPVGVGLLGLTLSGLFLLRRRIF